MKRGQITIFIILAIIIIGAILILFSINNKSQNNPKFETSNIESFIENCIKETGTEVIYKIGSGGGYYFPPNLSTDSGVPYYYFVGKKYIPSKQDIEKQISFYTAKKLFFCTKNFVDFPDFNITFGDITVKTSIEDNYVVFNVGYPLSIKKGENTKLIEKFDNIVIPLRLGVLHDSAEDITTKSSSYESVCLTCLLNVSVKNDFYVNLLDYDKDTIIFVFRDEKSKINDKPLKFIFANKYLLKSENE